MLTLMKYLLHLSLACVLFEYSNALTWVQLMETLKYGTSEISDILTPYAIENFPYGNVSKQCTSSLIRYAEGLKDFKPWAVQMLDATGRPQSSLLRGTYGDYGSFDECISLEVGANGQSDNFKGQFCMLSVTSYLVPILMGSTEKKSYIESYGYPPEWAMKSAWQEWGYNNLVLFMGICTPSTCSERDLTNIITAYALPEELQMSLSDCQLKDSRQWTTAEKLAIFCLTCIFITIILGTIVEVFERNMKQKKVMDYNEGKTQKILKTFSLISNMEILLEQNEKSSPLDFIHGMKFLNLMWTMFLHLCLYGTPWMYKQYRNLSNFTQSAPHLIMAENCLANSTYFLFLNGFLTAYSLKNKQRYTKWFFMKYLRTLPSVIFLMLMVFVIPVTFNGPVWNSTWSTEQNKCLKTGWFNLLFLTNFISYKENCSMNLWFASSLMQFLAISLPLLYLAKSSPRLAILLGILISIGCGVRDFLLSLQYQLGFPTPAAIGDIRKLYVFVDQIYSKPYNHFSAFGIGLIFGWINLKDFKISKFSLIIGWVFYTLFSFSLFFVVRYPTQNLVLTAFHNAFRGVFFGLQMGWLMYTCLNGTAGILGKIFSWKPFTLFNKIFFSVSIYHPILITAHEAMRRERFYFSPLNWVLHSLPLIAYGIMFGTIVFLMIDSPFNRLFDLLEDKKSASPIKSSNSHSGLKCAVAHLKESLSNGKEKEL